MAGSKGERIYSISFWKEASFDGIRTACDVSASNLATVLRLVEAHCKVLASRVRPDCASRREAFRRIINAFLTAAVRSVS